MSIWTQVFLINAIVFFSFLWIDRVFFYDQIENYLFRKPTSLTATLATVWAFGTVMSVPVYGIYLIIVA